MCVRACIYQLIAADKNLNEKNGPASKQLTMSTSPSSNSDTPSSSSPSSADDATDQILQDENAQTPSELTDEPDPDRLDQMDSPPKQVNSLKLQTEKKATTAYDRMYYFLFGQYHHSLLMSSMTIIRMNRIKMKPIHRR